MPIRCVWEHNGGDSLIYAENFPGAYGRGASKEEALAKLPGEVRAWLRWAGWDRGEDLTTVVVQEKASALKICDADSDVIFDAERPPMRLEEYGALKALALKSAGDFLALYSAVPDKDASALSARESFYGPIPRTAEEMYRHTKGVNDYYFGEIGVKAPWEGSMLEDRAAGFAALEAQPDFLNKPVYLGSYGEEWSLRKVLRRFLWHDRIHARAMYRMAARTFGPGAVPDIFRFDG